MNEQNAYCHPDNDQLEALQKKIKELWYTNKPVSAILQLIVYVKFHDGVEFLPGEVGAKFFYEEIVYGLYKLLGVTGKIPYAFTYQTAKGKITRAIRVKFMKPLETDEKVTLLWTVDSHSDLVKTTYLKSIMEMENMVIKGYIEQDEVWDVVEHANVSFLLSNSITFEPLYAREE